ncbi:MAG: PD40 domain-containing protein [Anaerolineae bacterium]|nr:PD40 domain-containing protein [Anaerolineae bacterium]
MAQRPTDFYLVVRQGFQSGTAYPLGSSTIAIGRHSDNQIVIDEPMISRQHVRLTWQGQTYLLEDLGSANGTWVNNVLVTGPVSLRLGDVIRLGQAVQLVFGDRTQAPVVASPSTFGMQNWFLFGLGGLVVLLIIVGLVIAGLGGYLLVKPAATPTEVSFAPVATLTPEPALSSLETATAMPSPTAITTPLPMATAVPSPTSTATPLPEATVTPPPTPTLPPTVVPTSTVAPTWTVAPTSTPQPVIQPVADPNKIAFTSNRDGNQEIYVMNTDGSGVTRLTNNPAEDHSPVWSPGGWLLAFVSTRDGNAEIYVMGADGRGQTNLTENPANDYDPAWSSNGARIAFVSSRDDPIRSDIWMMKTDGSGQIKLRDFGVSPAWSPDDTRLAGIFRFGGLVHLGLMPADGSASPQPLLQLGLSNSPAWSPDGKRIAFENAESPENSEILLINSDGSNLVNLTNNRDILDLYPTWSPNGKQIAFVSDRDGNNEIYVMNADGSRVTRLTHHPAWDAQPNWSP